MSITFQRNILVLLLVLTLSLFSVSNVSAACYVHEAFCNPNTVCTAAETTANTCKIVSGYSDGSCFSSSDPDAPAAISDCELGCCCLTGTGGNYRSTVTKGICGNEGTFYSQVSDCAATCGAIVNLNKYTLSGVVKYNNIVQPGVVVSLSSSSTFTATTDSSGKYTFTNIPFGVYNIKTTQNCDYIMGPYTLKANNITANVDIQCANVKLTVIAKNPSGVVIPNANLILDVRGTQLTGTTDSLGKYDFIISANSKLNITGSYTNSGSICTGVLKDVSVAGSNVTQNLVIDCQTFTVSVGVKDSLKTGSPYVTSGITVSNNHQQIAVQNNNRFLFNDNIVSGPLTVTATRTDTTTSGPNTINTVCTASSSLTLASSSPATQNMDLTFGNNNCCINTISYSSCNNGFMTKTTAYSGSCAKTSDVTQLSCAAQAQPCDWQCDWSVCGPKDFASTRSNCRLSNTPAGCDASIQTPLPPPTKPCAGNELCNNGVLDGSEECDYNMYTGAYEIASSCVATWHGIIPIINTAQDIYDFGLITNACNQADCSCSTPQSTTNPVDACAATPSTIGSINVNPVDSSYNVSIGWTTNNGGCNEYVDHYELKVCNNDTNGCSVGTYSTINASISKNTANYNHNGRIYPMLSPKTTYCYNLTMVYTSNVGLGATYSVMECVATGDDVCMKPHDTQWCSGNTQVSCNSNNNTLVSYACPTGQNCWFNPSSKVSSCLVLNKGNCDRCAGTFGIYSYMGYELPTNQPVVPGSTETYSIYCPSYINPNPNPNNVQGFSFGKEYIYGCYLDYSKTTINSVDSCSDVKSCYDYDSQSSCEQDYCSKFTIVGNNACEWNPYTINGLGKNIFGKGVCAPKSIETQKCGLCSSPQYNRLEDSCSGDVCGLYGDCYFDNYTSECWDRSKVVCGNYKDESGCIGFGGNNVSTNAWWLNGLGETSFTGLQNWKISGNNYRLSSLDGARLGVCKWLHENDVCFRDSDNYMLSNDCRIPNSVLRNLCELDTIAPVTNITQSKTRVYGLNMNLQNQVKVTDNNPWPILGDDSKYVASFANWTYITTFYCIDPDILPNGASSCYPNVTLKTTPSDAYIANLSMFHLTRNDNNKLFQFKYFSEDPARNLETIRNMTFILDGLEPNIRLITNVDPYQISQYQWLTNLTFTLALSPASFNGVSSPEQSLPVACSFVLTPASTSQAAAITFAFNKNENNNLPSPDNPSNNIITTSSGSVSAKYLALTDGDYDYVYSCTDSVGNTNSSNGSIHIDGDLRISDPKPTGGVYRSKDIPGGNVDISIKTNSTGTCRYSLTEFEYGKMATANIFALQSDGRQHATIRVVPSGNPSGPSGIYNYYVACNLTINGEYNIVPGSDADSPYFSVDDLGPRTSILFQNPDNNLEWDSYNYSPDRVSDNIVLKLQCNDSDPRLTTYSGKSMSFGCDDTKRYYCIPKAGITCNDPVGRPSDYKQFTDNIVLSYQDVNSQDKAIYGNNPSIFYYSIDNGGNIENFRIMPLSLRNMHINSPIVTYGPNTSVKIIDGETYVNHYSPLVFIKYDQESKITINDFRVLRIDDNSDTAISMNLANTNAQSTYVAFTYSSGFMPLGRYKVILNATDDDGNNNYNETYFNVNNTGGAVKMLSPRVGIGQSSVYDITLATSSPSDCKYGRQNLAACNSHTTPDGKSDSLNCWYTASNAFTPLGTFDGISHLLPFNDGKNTDFISPDNDLVYVVCKTKNSNSITNDYYSFMSFHYGHLTVPPTVDVNYILDPVMNDSKYNVIINNESTKITISLTTDQPSACRINHDDGNNLLDVDTSFDNEANMDDFNSYHLTHTYFIDYTNTGAVDGTRKDFKYDINCTNLAQFSTKTQAEVIIDLDTTPPEAGVTSVSQYLTLKEYKVTCTDHCTDKYQYAFTSLGGDCNALGASSGFGADTLYNETIPVTESQRLCVMVSDVLGRSAIKGFDITIVPFNKGAMTIVYPYEYSAFDGSVVTAYSPTNGIISPLQLMINTNDFAASCVYGISSPQYATYSMQQIYDSLVSANKLFDVTGSNSNQNIKIHTTNFKINTAINYPEAYVIVCKAYGTSPQDEPYISREVFFYWDNTNPIINTDSVSRIYDWNNRESTSIGINTDDGTMCNITDSSVPGATEKLMVDNSSSSIFESYVSGRLYQYHTPSVYYQNTDLNQAVNLSLSVNCTNRARISSNKDISIHYEMDKEVIATTSLDNETIFGSNDVTFTANTNIISTCRITSDEISVDMDSIDNNGLNHTKTVTLSTGAHSVEIICAVTNNNNIGIFKKTYNVFIDLTPPDVQLFGPNSYNGPDTTCSLDGFTIAVVMNDVDSGIDHYEYTITGDGITPNYVITDTGSLNTIKVPPLDGSSLLKENSIYTISVQATDLAGHTGGSSISIDVLNSNTAFNCDNKAPTLSSNTRYHTTASKNFATVNISCADSVQSGSSVASGCSAYFTYGFAENSNNCSGVNYDYYSGYEESLIFFKSSGTLCVQGRDLSGNTVNLESFINVSPITCGDGKIEQRLEPGYFGLDTRFNNWDWDAYGQILDEECDGTNLNSRTCLTEGFVGGSLSCSPVSCTIDTSSCQSGQNVKLVSPLPFGASNTSSYPLTVNSEFDSQCKYGLLTNSYDIVAAYGSLGSSMTAITDGSRNHVTNVGPINSINTYTEKYSICNANTNTANNPSGYGIVQVREGYDSSAPKILTFITDKYNDTITDLNDRSISAQVETDDYTICSISDSLNTLTNYIMYGAIDDFDSYSTSHIVTLDYSNLDPRAFNGPITLTTQCYNRAGSTTTATKIIYFNIATRVTITKLAPTDNTTMEYSLIYSLETNVLSSCTIGNTSTTMPMYGTGLYHEATVGIPRGYSNISVSCVATGGYETSAFAIYPMFGITTNNDAPPNSCGDGAIQKPNINGQVEECDFQNLDGKSCTQGFVGYNYVSGQLGCDANCMFDFTNCDTGNGWCGNSIIEGPNSNGLYEQCDGSVPNGITCQYLGFDSGTVSCSGCIINTSECLQEGQLPDDEVIPICSNHQLESGEQCEAGGNYTDIFCSAFGYYAGTVDCDANCMFDLTNCNTGNGWCGNNVIEGPNNDNLYEQCDGSVPNGITCQYLGFDSGTVSCSGCIINTSACLQEGQLPGDEINATCNNNQLESSEQCEIGGDLSDIFCSAFGYEAGAIGCDANCMFNLTDCKHLPTCGDGDVQKPNSAGQNEECDMADLNGKSCTQGFIGYNYVGGELGCTSGCEYDFTNCDTGAGWCGNDEIDGPNSNGLYEQCDGGVPSGLTCSDFGFDSGRLTCDGCMVNTTACLQEGQVTGGGFTPTCNNHELESGEQCEIGGNYTDIFCTTFGYDAGSITCASNCQFNLGSCSMNNNNNNTNGGGSSDNCGDNIKQSNEDCDDSVFNMGLSSTSCKLINTAFIGGNVRCTSDCEFDFRNCISDESDNNNTGENGELSPLCFNHIKDDSETDIDCGGSCNTCDLGELCIANGDCESSRCTNGQCVVNTCKNGVLDQINGETDIDCGGTCDACEIGSACVALGDCESANCVEGKCAENPCDNGVKDEGEADVDCGGSCVLCTGGSTCVSNSDCGSDECDNGICTATDSTTTPAIPRNPAKIPLIIIGIVLILGGGGYIIYKEFIEVKPIRHSGSSMMPGMQQTVHTPTLTPEQQQAMLERQREAMLKRKQLRDSERKNFLDKLDDTGKEKEKDKEVKEEAKPEPKKKESDEDEFVDISELKNEKEKNKAEVFSKLKEIGKSSEEKFPSRLKKKPGPTDKLDHTDALKMFGKVDRDIVMSKVFKDVLSKFLTNGRLSKENVSNILFEYLDKGIITKADVAKISSELKII